MKTIAIIFLSITALSAGSFIGVKQYKSWRQSGLTSKAVACLASGDYRNASLCARQALESNPDSVEASRVLAELAELGHKTNALSWRQRVVELEPRNPTNLLMLARSGLLFGAPNVTRTALAQIKGKDQENADFHKLRANLDWNAGLLPEAERHFGEAIRLEPTNLVSQMNLNLVRLPSTNAALALAARTQLQRLTTNAALRGEILRQLITDAEYRRKPAEALQFSQALILSSPNLPDQLRHCGLLKSGNDASLDRFLASLQNQHQTNAPSVSTIGRWMIAAAHSAQAVSWIQNLPEGIRQQRSVTIVLAEALLNISDWNGLAKHLERKSWDEEEHFRELLLARVAREQKNLTGTRSRWLKSLKAAGGNPDKLAQLVRATQTWKWRDEMDEALTAIVLRDPEAKWAEDFLSASLHLGGKTQALQNLFARTMEREPTNNIAKSNFATLGLLLNPGDKQSHRLAEEAFRAQGTNAFVASTYALSLHLQRQTVRSLQILEALPAEQLESPAIAVWYGYLLSEGGQPQRAKRYLLLAEKAQLLPEEKLLLAKAKGQG